MAMQEFPKQIGGFEILGTLGQGGMGVVYCARDHALQRDLAIKVQSGDWQGKPERMHRFLREARILARINHPNVVQIYTVGEHEGAPYFAMEMLEGSVADAARLRMPGIAQLKRWILEAARGLAAIHEMDVVHRDIKPGNLLLTRATSVEEEHVKVADLGIASAGGQFGMALTRAGAVLGTSGYLPPESFRLEHTLDARADQYSLGVVFFELLARRPPYQDMGDAALLASILEPRTPPDVRQFRPEVDAETAAILSRMLADDPDQRFQTTTALVQALVRVQEGPSAPQAARSEGVGAVEASQSHTGRVAPPTPMPPAPPSPGPASASPPPPPARAPVPAQPPAVIAAAPAAGAPTRQRGLPERSSTFAWKAAALFAFAAVVALAVYFLARSAPPAPEAAVETPASGPSPAEVSPAPVTLGTATPLDVPDPLQREVWAKYVLARYSLESAEDGETWTLDLLDQEDGVIDASLAGFEDEPIELSGRVESHAMETIGGDEWEGYRVRLLGPADMVLELHIRYSEDTTAGEGSWVYGSERGRVEIRESVEL